MRQSEEGRDRCRPGNTERTSDTPAKLLVLINYCYHYYYFIISLLVVLLIIIIIFIMFALFWLMFFSQIHSSCKLIDKASRHQFAPQFPCAYVRVRARATARMETLIDALIDCGSRGAHRAPVRWL